MDTGLKLGSCAKTVWCAIFIRALYTYATNPFSYTVFENIIKVERQCFRQAPLLVDIY